MLHLPLARRFSRLAPAFLLAAYLAWPTSSAFARPGEVSLRVELAGEAEKIKAWLDGRPEPERCVSVSPFVCARNRYANGDLPARVLTEELKKRGVKIKARAPVGVSGTLRQVPLDKDNKESIVKMTVEVESQSGKSEMQSHIDLVEPDAVTLLFPTPLVGPGPLPSPQEMDKLSAKLEGTRIKAGKEGKFAVEIVVVDNPSAKTKVADYKALKPRLDDGLPFANIKRDQAYAVRLINESNHDAAALLSIDGLNMFRFSKQAVSLPYVVVRKQSSVLIRGWYISDKDSKLFVATSRDLGAWVGEGVEASSVGRITVQFHAAWSKAEDRPKDEPLMPRSPLSTGVGMEIESKFKPAKMTVGGLRESIPVLYSRDSGR